MQKEILKSYYKKLLQRRYSPNTQKTYLSLFKKFLLFFKSRQIDEITKTEIEDYIYFLIQSKNMTHTYTVNGLTCSGCANKVKSQLEQHPYVTSADISLEKNMAKLTMDRHVTTEELQGLLGPNSQYTISSTTKQPHDTEQEKNGFTTYKPLLLIFLFITVVSAIASIDSGQIEPMQWMGYFMGGFFIVFSFFKFLDLNGFADSYAMYDVLAKRVKAYGLAYPFIELALGIAYLTHFEPKITYITTIAVMGFSSIGVIQSVLDKRKIRCACLGAVFNLPMSTVTIIENLLMVVMAAFMLAAT